MSNTCLVITSTHKRTHICTHVRTHTRAHTHTQAHVHNTRCRLNKVTQTCYFDRTHINIHTPTHTYTYAHTQLGPIPPSSHKVLHPYLGLDSYSNYALEAAIGSTNPIPSDPTTLQPTKRYIHRKY
jgi:hypothetical protein